MSSVNRVRRGEVEVRVQTDDTQLDGRITLPDRGRGLVIFAHGLGHGTASMTDRFIAAALHKWGIGTLLVDLLTPGERAMDDRSGGYRQDCQLITRRLVQTTHWAAEQPLMRDLAVGYLGVGTGAAAAIGALTEWSVDASALALRSGRLDLAPRLLGRVRCPSLLLVGELDRALVHVNRTAASHFRVNCDVVVIPGVERRTHEPAALDTIATVVRGFFGEHLQHQSARSPLQ